MATNPSSLQGSFPSASIQDAYNPQTKKNDLAVILDGGMLSRFYKLGLTERLEEAGLVEQTVKAPDSVYLTDDDEYTYFKRYTGYEPRALFGVWIRPTGGRVIHFAFEDSDASGAHIPKSRGADRFKERLK